MFQGTGYICNMAQMGLRRSGLMGRIFLVDEKDTIRQIPYAFYLRLINRDSAESFPEYAGKRVRCAVVWIEVAKRKPSRIREIDCTFLPFNGRGGIDTGEWARKKSFNAEVTAAEIGDFLSLVQRKRGKSNLIDAKHRFLKKRYDHEFKWKPSQQIEEAIASEILGRKKT